MKIEKLTDAEKARFPEFIDKWTKIGLCTEPANRKLAEEGIIEAYQIAGLSAPKIVWCGSPLSQGLTRAILLDKKFDIGKKVRDSVGDSVGASVGDSVWDSVRDSVWASVGDSVWASVGDSVGASVRASVWDSVGDSVWASVRDSVGDSVGASVRASVWASVWALVRASLRASVGDSVGASVRASVWDSVGDSVWASVRDSVRDSVGDSVGDSVWASVGASVGDSVYGQHDAEWLAFYDFFKEVSGLKSETEKLNGLWKISQNAGWFLPHEKICWISERHTKVVRDNRSRLHCENGAAVEYPDGWAIYAWHGVRVPEWIITTPEKITADLIDKESNQEIKRVMIERFGLDKFVKAGTKIYQDDFGTLYKKNVTTGDILTMVHVINGSKEPDGTYKDYFLEVHPELCPLYEDGSLGKPQELTAKNAVASTYGMRGEEYLVTIRT